LEATLVLCAGTVLLSSSATLPLTIDVRARAVAPGEPLRILVAADPAVESLEGSLLGVPIALRRLPSPDGAGRWAGWAMIGLLQEAGIAAIEVQGRTGDGRFVAGTVAITIAERPFPTEELTVAPSYVEPPAEVRERLARERKQLAELYGERRAAPLQRAAFLRPVPGEQTSVFGTRRVFNGKARDPHPGMDLRAATGDAVHASGPGRIVLAQELYYSGNTVLIDHGEGLFTIYAHLSEFRVEEGEDVAAGQVVALSGATGRVTGPHLHWGAKIGNRPFDPTALLDSALWD
jgi:murein DD-endopeptidase MepM/ murein hydrolase activator NlpD